MINSENAFMYRILPGLPATGDPARSFSPDGSQLHVEGLVVEFDGTWCGNFAKGMTRHSALYPQFAPRVAHVISSGNHYIVDVPSGAVRTGIRNWIGASLFCEVAGAIIVFDLTQALAYQGHSQLWQSERISWDGIRSVREEGGTIFGEGYDPMADEWVGFELSTITGQHSGGSYPQNTSSIEADLSAT